MTDKTPFGSDELVSSRHCVSQMASPRQDGAEPLKKGKEAAMVPAIKPIDEPAFLEYCGACKRKHRMTVQPCPSCGGRGGWIPMPKSAWTRDHCMSLSYECDGCYAYRDRYA